MLRLLLLMMMILPRQRHCLLHLLPMHVPRILCEVVVRQLLLLLLLLLEPPHGVLVHRVRNGKRRSYVGIGISMDVPLGRQNSRAERDVPELLRHPGSGLIRPRVCYNDDETHIYYCATSMKRRPDEKSVWVLARRSAGGDLSENT